MNTTVAKRIDFATNRKSQCIGNDKPVVLFLDMDFYFTYNEDADTTSTELHIDKKTASDNDFTYTVFSARKLDQYLPILIRKGHRVAIVDNMF